MKKEIYSKEIEFIKVDLDKSSDFIVKNKNDYSEWILQD